jgi:hypothetical protein
MFVKNFRSSNATATIFVQFSILPIKAAYGESLREHLWETVLFERNNADEHLIVGEFFNQQQTDVEEVISYQFGDLYNVESACEEVALQLQQQAEVWLEKMGGYENVKA